MARYKVVRICCTDRGQHRLQRLDRVHVYPSGFVDLRNSRMGISLGHPGAAWNYRTLRCPQCRRNTEINSNKLRAILAALAGVDRPLLDISLLTF